MPIRSYKKTYVNKTGDAVVYEYKKDTSVYSVRSYNKKKELHPKIECPNCGKMVYEFYMPKHQTKSTCKRKVMAPIEAEPINLVLPE